MLKQLLEKIEKGRALLAKVRKQAGDDYDFSKVTEFSGTDEEKCASMRKLNDDLVEWSKQLDGIRAIEAGVAREEKADRDAIENGRPSFGDTKGGERHEVKKVSFGEAILKSGALDRKMRGEDVEIKGIELKTLFERSAGFAPESLRTGLLVPYAVRPIQVLDIIPKLTTGMAAYKYMDETTLDTSLVVEKAEGAAAGEAQFAWTERSVTIEKLPAYLPVTDEQLEDVEGIASLIDARLGEAIMRRADYQSLNGTGVTPLMLGILQKSGTQATAAVAGDGNADTILRAIKDVSVTGRAIASAIIMHQTDWMNERLRKTLEGAYIWGSPADAGPQGMWGVPVAQSDSLTAGTAVVGDFRMHSAFVMRQDLKVRVGLVNDDLVKGRQAVVGTVRGAFVWNRAAAFSVVTLPA